MGRLEDERARRGEQWMRLLAAGGPKRVAPSLVRELGIYGGAQGVWVDKDVTVNPQAPNGVAVGLLHTGRSYADELSDEGVLYHYPATRRPESRDANEATAMRAAATLRLPVFVITHSPDARGKRDIYRGFIEGVDDRAALVLVLFDAEPPTELVEPPTDDEPFEMFDRSPRKQRLVKDRPRQQTFKFLVLKMYGPSCAMCRISAVPVLDGIHIVDKEESGSDDPRNGLVLCATHHRALDARLVAIDPELALRYPEGGLTATELGITVADLSHLPSKPHLGALQWRWERWVERNPAYV